SQSIKRRKITQLFQSSTTNPKDFGKVLMRTPSKRIPRNLEKFKHATQVVSISFQGELVNFSKVRGRCENFGKVHAILKRTPLFQSSTTNPKDFGKVLMRTPSKRIPRNLEDFKRATQVVSISFQGELRNFSKVRGEMRKL